MVDPRWAFDDEDKEYFVAGIHTMDSILVGLPAPYYDHVHNVDNFAGASTDVYDEMDEYRNEMAKCLKEHNTIPMKWYCLKFPPRPGMTGVRLSVREIYRSESLSDDTSLDLEYYPVTAEHKTCGQYTTWWATWNVVVNDIGEKEGDRKRGKPETQKKLSKAAAAAAKYAGELYGTPPPRNNANRGGTTGGGTTGGGNTVRRGRNNRRGLFNNVENDDENNDDETNNIEMESDTYSYAFAEE